MQKALAVQFLLPTCMPAFLPPEHSKLFPGRQKLTDFSTHQPRCLSVAVESFCPGENQVELFSFLSDKDLFAEIYRCPGVPHVGGHWRLHRAWCFELHVPISSGLNSQHRASEVAPEPCLSESLYPLRLKNPTHTMAPRPGDSRNQLSKRLLYETSASEDAEKSPFLAPGGRGVGAF